ncbi:metallophosphoesterase family protein [Horticoccus sp. 23ND18S-11]|uniref:metallophosphoesterase family protein n=1 Tax=Horticoccus sp. 23ND18S-11 TaxID=3391832 RepID=UPI0039C9CF64
MKRRHFLGHLAAGGAIGATFVPTAALAQSPGVTGQLIRTPLVLMAPRPDGLEAVWAVSRLSRGRLEWQSDDGLSGEAATDTFGFVPQGQSILRVRLAGLKPGLRYRVRSVTTAADNGETETSPWKSFRTLNPNAAETSFVVWNDTHVNNPTIQRLHERTPAADFLLWNGDTCNDWKTEDLLVPTLLHPGQRDISEGRPLFVTWGNHDVRGKHAFEMPGMVATPSGRPFWAFRSGPVAVICLHTGEDKPDAHPSFGGRVAFDRLRKEQAVWLAETIRRPELSAAPYRVVFCHIPLRWVDESPQDYGDGGFDRHSGRSRAAWHDALVAWKTQVIISGHTHRTTWLPPAEGFPYGQLIGGGPTPQAATWMQAKAGADRLHIVVRDLEGAIKHDVSLQPLG